MIHVASGSAVGAGLAGHSASANAHIADDQGPCAISNYASKDSISNDFVKRLYRCTWIDETAAPERVPVAYSTVTQKYR